MREPDANDVVNEPLIENEVGAPFWDKALFVESVEDGSPGWGRGNTHASS